MSEAENIENYAPLSHEPGGPPVKPVRKRRKLAETGTAAKHTYPGVEKKPSRQRRVSEGLRVIKPRSTAKAILPYDDDGDATERIVSPLSDHHDTPHLPCDSATELGDEDFDDDLDDDEFLRLTSDMIDTGEVSGLKSSQVKSSIAQPSYGKTRSISEDTIFALEEGSSSQPSTMKKFVSPVTLTTRLFAANEDLGYAIARKPIVRPPFPSAVRDRSPIIGLSTGTLLRTCFRMGEAVNQAHQASKSGHEITFELYARILESERNTTSQHFTFCDLFHAKPPYIKAVYEAVLWKSVELFNYDSARLLKQGRICRCIGKMKREGKEWIMTVLNIWEATWEDVRWVEGIVNS